MPKGYTTKTEIENFLLITIDNSLDTQLNTWIEMAEGIIDREVGYSLKADAAYSERVFYGNGSRELLIDYTPDIQSVVINGSTLSLSDYVKNPSGGPYSTLTLKYGLWDGFSSDGGSWPQEVTLSAKWGYATTVPADIKLAATILVAEIIRQGDQSLRTKTSESVGRVSVSYASVNQIANNMPSVQSILNTYKRLVV